MRRWRVALLVVVMAVGGCSSSGDASSSTRSTGPLDVDDEAPTATSTTVSSTASPRHRWTAKGALPDGSSFEVSLEQFGIMPAEQIEASFGVDVDREDATYTRYCDPERSRDAFAPFRLSVRNTSGSYSLQNLGVNVFAHYKREGSGEDVPQYPKLFGIDSKGECHDQAAVKGAWNFPPNGSVELSGVLVLPSYYSPEQPSGDPERAASVRYDLTAGPTLTKNITVEVTGDKAEDCVTIANGYESKVVGPVPNAGITAGVNLYRCLDASLG